MNFHTKLQPNRLLHVARGDSLGNFSQGPLLLLLLALSSLLPDLMTFQFCWKTLGEINYGVHLPLCVYGERDEGLYQH